MGCKYKILSRISAYEKGCRCNDCVEYYNEYHRNYYKTKYKFSESAKNKWFRYRLSKYNLDETDYERIYHAQKGICAICGINEATDIDHDHRTGVVRGILCNGCNTGLGMF